MVEVVRAVYKEILVNSLMMSEAYAVADLLEQNVPSYPAPDSPLALSLRREGGRLVVIGRGSSGAVGDYLVFLASVRFGNLAQRLPLSVVTAYKGPLNFQGTVVLAVSQSGASPDLVGTLKYCGERGARSIALVNASGSQLAAVAQESVAVNAGEERSVAATKSFMLSLTAGIALLAAWYGDRELGAALKALPEQLRRVRGFDWSSHLQPFKAATHMMVVARGYGLPLALELALKLKETSGIQAEAYSSAEVRHGPMTLIEKGYPLVVMVTPGPCQDELLTFGQEMRARGAQVLLVGSESQGSVVDVALPFETVDELAPLCLMQALYAFAEGLAVSRGRNPDKPAYLSKVTLTH